MENEVAYVGCYTTAAGGRGVGIQPVRPSDGALLDPMPASNPSFLISHPSLPVLYAVSEQESTAISAYAIEANGQLRLRNTLATGGEGGCHLAFDADRGLIVIAHYGTGSIAICSVTEDGSLDRLVDSHRFTGTGPDPDRQQQSHAHMAMRDGAEWLIADLGTDQIHRLRLDPAGSITAIGEIATPPGSGPRHLVIRGDALVLAGELSAELWLADRVRDGWSPRASVPSTRSQRPERAYPSGIVLAEDRIVVANRGVDTIATFVLDPKHGLTLIDETPTGGAWPRDLTWHRGRLWVANEHSDSVTVFAPDGAGWRLIQTLEVPSPACVVFPRARFSGS